MYNHVTAYELIFLIYLAWQKYASKVLYKANSFYAGAVQNRVLIPYHLTPSWLV
jgi:hypothetical protein